MFPILPRFSVTQGATPREPEKDKIPTGYRTEQEEYKKTEPEPGRERERKKK